MEGIKERIAADPYAVRFALTGPLRRYGRLKGLGLPDRYRLFFRVFQQMVRRGDLPQDWDKLQDELNRP